MKKIYLSPPHMSSDEKNFLIEAFESNWISPLGPHVDNFEIEMSKYLNVNSCCALSSGTASLHLALQVLNIKENDKVLVPSLTFVATANAVLYQKAVPIFMDVELDHWILDPTFLETALKKYRPKAIISVDLYGNSCKYDDIVYLCKKYNTFLIEDAAEALGSEYKSKKCSTFGDIGILSFNGNKIITTSSGGMLVSENSEYTEKAKFLSSQAREPELHYEHKEIGFNYRMSNLLAAIGIGQLNNLDSFVKRRREIFSKYQRALSAFDEISFIKEQDSSFSNCWLSTFIIKPKNNLNSRNFIKLLLKNNIEARPVWKPLHMQKLFKNSIYIKKNKFDNSKYLFSNGICLPSGSNLKDEDQDRIIDLLLKLSINP
jgi:pyridoxal phosphate-dependent aminotransferase EpsN